MTNAQKPGDVASSTRRVKLIRVGVELATHRPAMGEIVELPNWQASALVRNSAGVFADDEP